MLLDLEETGRGRAYARLLREELSPDGSLWAFVVDECGGEEGTLRVKDLATGDLLPDAIERVRRFAWGKGTTNLLFVRREEGRFRLLRHRLDGSLDVPLFEHDDHFFFSDRGPELAVQRMVRHGPWDWRMHHLEATEEEARDNRWRDVRTSPSFRGENPFVTDSFRDHRVEYRTERGRCSLTVLRGNARLRTIAFPHPVYDLHPLWPRQGPRACLESYRFVLESLTMPPVCYQYDPSSDELRVVQATEVPGLEPSRYRTRWLEVTASDGAKIPVSIACREAPSLRRRPLLLLAYGAYGVSFPARFDALRLSLLDRGVALAVAGVRGGGDGGGSWYRAGQGPNKGRSVQDLIAVARHLIGAGIAEADRLAIASGSAGGFLVAAAVQERPDLFRAVLADVPMTDLLGCQGAPDARPSEHEEWGDPAVAEEYRCLRRLCPTANLAARAYPAMMLRTAWHDARVPYWSAARYVARLRAVKTDRNPVLLLTSWSGGHFGPSRRTDRLREEARQYAFLLHCFGITE